MPRKSYYEVLYASKDWVNARLMAARRALQKADARAVSAGYIQQADGFWYWNRDRLLSRIRRYERMLERIEEAQ